MPSVANITDWKNRALINVAEAEMITGLSRATLYRMMVAGTLSSVKIGKRRCIRPEALLKVIEAREEGVV